MTKLSMNDAMNPASQIRCLSLHSRYACQHRGECCRAWQVPAEPHVVAFVRKRNSRVEEDKFFVRDAAGSSSDLHLAHRGGACVFRSANRCTIHAEGGEMALPVSCRHFPRVILRDGRGMLISLSHYCPTAVALLFISDPAPPGIESIPGRSPLALQEPIDGLDARDALPPLLHPGMLTDLAGYDAWERCVIEMLANDIPAARSLGAIENATETIRQWAPQRGSLSEAVRSAFGTASTPMAASVRSLTELNIVRRLYRGALRLDAPDDLERAWDVAAPAERFDLHRPVANYLAARAFGNWIAYQGRGLRSIVAWLRACHDVVRVVALSRATAVASTLTAGELREAIRFADLVMLHTIDSQAFADELRER